MDGAIIFFESLDYENEQFEGSARFGLRKSGFEVLL